MMMLLAPPGPLNAGSLSRSWGAISALYQLAKLTNDDTWGKPSPMALREDGVGGTHGWSRGVSAAGGSKHTARSGGVELRQGDNPGAPSQAIAPVAGLAHQQHVGRRSVALALQGGGAATHMGTGTGGRNKAGLATAHRHSACALLLR
jgi:hypothetical protein